MQNCSDVKYELHCYNKGCNKKFAPNENSDTACTYHPGEPVFRNAYKSWSCCDKKTTDFTTFLHMKGCATGPHNPEKPPEPPKPPPSSQEVVVCKPIAPAICASRAMGDQPLERLNVNISQSLSDALEKYEALQQQAENQAPVVDNGVKVDQSPQPGDKCKRSGCQVVFSPSCDEESLEVNAGCCFHPGVPIFHEGLKFWSCCQKRTTDFDAFMAQVGCSKSPDGHLWKKEPSPTGKDASTSCRYDWHQTGSTVTITVYAKNCVPAQSQFKANSVNLSLGIDFEFGQKSFGLEVPLWGRIDIDRSEVNINTLKVEVQLKKADPVLWPSLTYKEKAS